MSEATGTCGAYGRGKYEVTVHEGTDHHTQAHETVEAARETYRRWLRERRPGQVIRVSHRSIRESIRESQG